MSDGWRDLLRQAAALLEKDGWCQCTMSLTTGERCLVAAMRDARKTLPDLEEAFVRLEKFLGIPIIFWNDMSSRRVEHVLAALRECADG